MHHNVSHLCARFNGAQVLLAAAAVNLVETKIVTQMKIKELKEKLEANTSETFKWQ